MSLVERLRQAGFVVAAMRAERGTYEDLAEARNELSTRALEAHWLAQHINEQIVVDRLKLLDGFADELWEITKQMRAS